MDKRRYIVARTDEIPPGSRRIVELEGRSIGVFNVHGRYVAVLNVCPHELAPVCLGRLGGTTLRSAPGEWVWGREGEILPMPWQRIRVEPLVAPAKAAGMVDIANFPTGQGAGAIDDVPPAAEVFEELRGGPGVGSA